MKDKEDLILYFVIIIVLSSISIIRFRGVVIASISYILVNMLNKN